MADIYDAAHEAHAEQLFRRACTVLEMEGFQLRPLRRRVRGRGKLRSLALGYTKIGSKVITVDLYTPRTMKPRKIDAILRVICHELAHHQAPPRLKRVWLRYVREIHHPQFWMQYKENIQQITKDPQLAVYFGT